MQLLTEKYYKAKSNQGSPYLSAEPARESDVFVCNYCQEKVIKLNQIKEAHDIEAQDWQEGIIFLKCNYYQKKVYSSIKLMKYITHNHKPDKRG